MKQPRYIVQEHFLSADSARRRQTIRQLLTLYLENAVKYAPGGAVSCERTREG